MTGAHDILKRLDEVITFYGTNRRIGLAVPDGYRLARALRRAVEAITHRQIVNAMLGKPTDAADALALADIAYELGEPRA